MLHAGPPADAKLAGPAAVDLYDPANGDALAADPPKPWTKPETIAAWHGTLLPKTDADVWLASAFHDEERIVALQNAMRHRSKGELGREDRDALAVALYGARAKYNLSAGRTRRRRSTTRDRTCARPTGITSPRARAFWR